MAANHKGKQSMNSGQDNVAKDDHINDELLDVFYGDSKPFEEWVFYSGYTFHMCPNQDWFSTYEIMSKGAILMGNDAPYEIASIGTIRIKMFDGIVRMLGKVKHVTY